MRDNSFKKDRHREPKFNDDARHEMRTIKSPLDRRVASTRSLVRATQIRSGLRALSYI